MRDMLAICERHNLKKLFVRPFEVKESATPKIEREEGNKQA
jgi:hypothetical protein